MLEFGKKIMAAIWRHWVVYLLLALGYVLVCAGVMEKDLQAFLNAGFYAALAMQRH